MLRVVFDTVGFVRSIISPYNYWGKILFTHFDDYSLFVSKPVLYELLEVLDRAEMQASFRNIKGMDKKKIIEIVSAAQIVEIKEDFPLTSRDPKDDKFLATADAARAHYLVSEDKDLLDLKEYEGIKIISAETFLQVLEKEK